MCLTKDYSLQSRVVYWDYGFFQVQLCVCATVCVHTQAHTHMHTCKFPVVFILLSWLSFSYSQFFYLRVFIKRVLPSSPFHQGPPLPATGSLASVQIGCSLALTLGFTPALLVLSTASCLPSFPPFVVYSSSIVTHPHVASLKRICRT